MGKKDTIVTKLNYHNFPYIKFCMLYKDPSLCEEYGVDPKEWEVVREQYDNTHMSQESKALLESYKKAIKASIELSKATSLMKVVNDIEGDWKPYFEASNVKFTGDKDKDLKYVYKLFQKAETKVQVFGAQFEKMEKEVKEAQKKENNQPFEMDNIYESLASFELHGYAIPDYETITCGKVDAIHKNLKKKSAKNGK